MNIFFLLWIWVCVTAGAVTIDTLKRVIDLTKTITREAITAHFVIPGDGNVNIQKKLVIAVTAQVAFVEVKGLGSKDSLQLEVEKDDCPEHLRCYSVNLHAPLTRDTKVSLEIYMTYGAAISAFPDYNQQGASQIVKFEGNLHFLSPYPVLSQKLVVKLPSKEFYGHSPNFSPTFEGNMLHHEINEAVPEYSISHFGIQYIHDTPIIRIPKMIRRIMPNFILRKIDIREDVRELRNEAFKVEGGFSKVDFVNGLQMAAPSNILRAFKYELPRDSVEHYFVDDIGHIHGMKVTGNLSSTSVALHPRFPLAGGWSYSYSHGYTLPISHAQLDEDGFYSLEVSLFDLSDDVLIDRLELQLLLPEGSSDILIDAENEVADSTKSFLREFLDIEGSKFIILVFKNLVQENKEKIIVKFKLGFWRKYQKIFLAFSLMISLIAAYFASKRRVSDKSKIKKNAFSSLCLLRRGAIEEIEQAFLGQTDSISEPNTRDFVSKLQKKLSDYDSQIHQHIYEESNLHQHSKYRQIYELFVKQSSAIKDALDALLSEEPSERVREKVAAAELESSALDCTLSSLIGNIE